MTRAVNYGPWPAVWDEAAVAQLPEDGHRYEIYDGALLVSPPPNWGHQGVVSDFVVMLHQAAPAGWRILTDPGVDCGSNKLIPDLAVLRPHKTCPHPLQLDKQYGPAEAVALVVEVESPSTRMNDRNAKHASYAAVGIEAYWRVERTEAGCVIVVSTLSDRVTHGVYVERHRLHPGQSAVVTSPFDMELVNNLAAADAL